MSMQKNQIASSMAQVILLTGMIKLTAFLKQVVLAKYFGASIELDLYLLSADTLGDFSAAVFAAFSVSVMTLYAKRIAQQQPEDAVNVISAALKLTVPTAVICAILFYIFSPQIAAVLTANYEPEAQTRVALYMRLVSPAVVFSGVAYILAAVLDARKIFWPGKLIHFILSFFVMTAAVFFGRENGALSLVVAYTAAYFAFMSAIIFCGRRFFRLRNLSAGGYTAVKPLLTMFFPAFLGNAAVEINALIDKLLATNFGEGYLSSQTYGTTLNNFVVSIFVLAPAGVLISYLAEYMAKRDEDRACAVVNKGILLSTAILLPVMSVTLCCAEDIASIIYKRGAFDQLAVQKTAYVLYGYAVGFVFVAIREILIKVHLAKRDSKTVMVNGLISIFFNILFSIILSQIFGIMGISMGTSIAAILGMLLCGKSIKKELIGFKWRAIIPELIKIGVAGLSAAGAVLPVLLKLNPMGHLTRFALTCVSVFSVDILILALLKSRIFFLVKDLLRQTVGHGK